MQSTFNVPLSRGHTTNKCWPTCVCQQCWQTNVCRVFKKLANIFCWTTMLAVYELVHFLLANKRQTVRCDWLAVVNIMAAAECTDASCVDYINYTSHFTFALYTTAPKQISGAYVFAYEQLNISLLQQRCRRLLCPAISAILLSNKMLSCVTRMLANNCLPTNVVQQLLANICLSCVRGFKQL